MTSSQKLSSSSLLLLFALLSVSPQLSPAAPPPSAAINTPAARHDTLHQQGAAAAAAAAVAVASGADHGSTRTHRREDTRVAAASEDRPLPAADVNAAWALAAVLVDSMDQPRKEVEVEEVEEEEVEEERGRERGLEGAEGVGGEVEHNKEQTAKEEEEEEEDVEKLRQEVTRAARQLVDYRETMEESEEREEEEEEERGYDKDQLSAVNHEGSEVKEGKTEERKEEEEVDNVAEKVALQLSNPGSAHTPEIANDDSDGDSDGNSKLLQREARGYFQNIDLGLQDNEILPPLKGYKAYNQQLAQATKTLKWHEAAKASKTPAAAVLAPLAPPTYERNFMDDFDVPGQEELVEELGEEVLLSRQDEEARARAEQEEMLRQQAEAEAAREEEQRLAGIASDMLIQYMERKAAQQQQQQQQTSYLKQRQKASMLAGGFGPAAEDKRSNEVDGNGDLVISDGMGVGVDVDMDGGDVELETIDRLIEISSKLHLPADDVVEIISNVEEKKRRKEAPPALSTVPRYRPLVAPARPPPPQSSAPVLYKYGPVAPVSAVQAGPMLPLGPPKKLPKNLKSANPYKKWYKEKGKSKAFKQDYWFKPSKQFMAYPSYPYYQKPYRAYYPVYFPPPKPRLYPKPAFAYDYDLGDSLDYAGKPPKWGRSGGKGRGGKGKGRGKGLGKGGQSWKVMALPPPAAPYIPNYILPHPRTYYPLPMPKPPQQGPALGSRRPSSARFYPPDYDNDGAGETQDSDEELENFIEKMYFHRRIF